MIQHGSACPVLEKFANIIRIFSIPALHYSHPVPWTWHSSISLFFILHLIHIYFPMETYLWNNCDKSEGTHWKVSFFGKTAISWEISGNVKLLILSPIVNFQNKKFFFFFLSVKFFFSTPYPHHHLLSTFPPYACQGKYNVQIFFPNLPFSTV